MVTFTRNMALATGVLVAALAVGGCSAEPEVQRNAGVGDSQTLKSLLSVQRLKVEEAEEWAGDEPEVGVIGFEGYVGKPDSIKTFMVSRDRQKCYEHGDQQGAISEMGSGIDAGETVDIRDEQGDHVFSVDPYTDEEYLEEGPYVYGIVTLAFDGDGDNACAAYSRVSGVQDHLKQELKNTIGTIDRKNYTNAKQTMLATANRLNDAFGESGDPTWVKIIRFFDNFGDSDDYAGANMAVFLPAATDLADALDTPEIVASTDVYTAAIVKPGTEFRWEGVTDNRKDELKYRLYNYGQLDKTG
ncbi:MAG: hypothetical protein U0R64_03155 [Candidatus Nanopelagicales bacterium]